MISVSVSHSQLVGKATSRHRQPHTPGQPQGEEMLPSISCSHFCPHRSRDTHTHTERKAQACVWGKHVSFDSEVLSIASSSVRDSVKHRKHNDQTVLQVVLVAQLCVDITVDVLFCLGVGLGVSSFRCILMEKDGNGGSEWVYE